jgi:2-keto-3-deoxy-L-rhamnonate aldolase RhmA
MAPGTVCFCNSEMHVRFMMITRSPEIASYAVASGVDRIFVDLEQIGKRERQGHLNTWISAHNFDDVAKLRAAIGYTELLVRLNPWHVDSPKEIQQALSKGADLLMLPMFSTIKELRGFCEEVRGRVPVIPLVETAEAFDLLDEVATTPGVEEVYIGLNDLHLSLGMGFMFEPLANGMLDHAATRLRALGMPFGFGGVARVGEGLLPAEKIMGEHVRLGSSSVILSRTFHRQAPDLATILTEMDFPAEIQKLREAESFFQMASEDVLQENKVSVRCIVEHIIGRTL